MLIYEERLRIERLKTVRKFRREIVKENPILLIKVYEIVLHMGRIAIENQ